MTANQVAYWSLQETKRANLANEANKADVLAETARSNLAKESETNRSNVAKETETQRSNMAKEFETNRSNVAKESETSLHNRATEVLGLGNMAFNGLGLIK